MNARDIKGVIDMQSVDFSYGAVPVLLAIDLQVREGEFLGIVGPNAGGKSTLLKLILGLLQPRAGRIRVLGRPPRSASRMLGYVPQYPSFPHDSTLDQFFDEHQFESYRCLGRHIGKRLCEFLPDLNQNLNDPILADWIPALQTREREDSEEVPYL